MRLLLVVALVGCGGSPSRPVASEPVTRIAMPVTRFAPAVATVARPIPVATVATVAVTEPPPPPFPTGVRSVRFTTVAVAYAAPTVAAPRLGVIAAGTRSEPLHAQPAGDGCQRRWISIAPRGWVCEDTLAPSPDPPTPAPPTSLDDDDEPTLGVYGVVRGGDVVAYATRDDASAHANGRALGRATSLRAIGTTTIDGTAYWIASDGSYVEAAAIVPIAASHFHGVAISDGELHVAWVHRRDQPHAAAELRDLAGTVTGEAGPRARVTVKEVSADGATVRITDGDWIARADLRMPTLAAPPDGVGADDRWLDVDLDDQVLVAYQGTRPVYATLVSTGRADHATPEEIAHIATKYRTADMVSTKVDVYAVADVPWTMYYDGHFALHTSYWHDGFGDVRSHGCVNLAPRDARALYDWSSPDVPAGWTAVYASESTRGTTVRVRSKRVPEPTVRG